MRIHTRMQYKSVIFQKDNKKTLPQIGYFHLRQGFTV